MPSLAEHSDVLIYLLGAALTGLGGLYFWTVTRTLTRIDQNQAMIAQKLDSLESRVDRLEGEHAVYHHRG